MKLLLHKAFMGIPNFRLLYATSRKWGKKVVYCNFVHNVRINADNYSLILPKLARFAAV